MLQLRHQRQQNHKLHIKWLKSVSQHIKFCSLNGPCQANLVLIAYASCEGSGEPAHPRSLARTFAARSYIQWIKRNLQTESQIPGPSEWLGIRSWNLSWRNFRRHKFAWRGSNYNFTVHLMIHWSLTYKTVQCKICHYLRITFCSLSK